MKIIEPGHIYEFHTLDKKEGDEDSKIVFVNREPGSEHCGTQTQDVLRALIDRTLHCDHCLPWVGNDEIVYHLRQALVLHEMRALQRKAAKGIYRPERVLISDKDGHYNLIEKSEDPTDGEYAPERPDARRNFAEEPNHFKVCDLPKIEVFRDGAPVPTDDDIPF